MKEVTYGWYPSVKDVYRPKGRPSSYHLECFYKYGDSLYHQGQLSPPEPELFVRGYTSRSATPTPKELRRKAHSLPVPKFSRIPKLHIPTPTQCWANNVPETSWGVVGDSSATNERKPSSEVSWPLPRKSSDRLKDVSQQQLQKEQKHYGGRQPAPPRCAWGMQPGTEEGPHPASGRSGAQLDWPMAHKAAAGRSKSCTPPSAKSTTSQTQQLQQQSANGQKSRPESSPSRGSVQDKVQTPRPPSCKKTPVSTSKRPTRVQSATVRRQKTPLPARPVTACSGRYKAQDGMIEATLNRVSLSDKPETSRPPSSRQPTSRPKAPVPFVYDTNHPSIPCAEPAYEDLSEEALKEEVFDDQEWEETIKKYGWRAEVHGNPYGLKKFPKRVRYAVPCAEPDVLPQPPQFHMETNEPFFYNTIPKRPMAFVVDKEWMSEVLLAKRLELQKRQGGINYSYKNFAFVY